MIELPQSDDVIEVPQYYLWCGDDGIVRVVYKPDQQLPLEDLKMLLARIHELAGGDKALVISDFSRINRFGVDVETRQYATGPQASALLQAVAIVSETHISRMLANILIYMTSPPFPMQSFKSESDAVQWLQEIVYSEDS